MGAEEKPVLLKVCAKVAFKSPVINNQQKIILLKVWCESNLKSNTEITSAH